jgi:hypothetical protein
MTILYNAPKAIGAGFSIYPDARAGAVQYYFFPHAYRLAVDAAGRPELFEVRSVAGAAPTLAYHFLCRPVMPTDNELANAKQIIAQQLKHDCDLWPFEPDFRDGYSDPALVPITPTNILSASSRIFASYRQMFAPILCTLVVPAAAQDDMARAFQHPTGWMGQLNFSFVAGWVKFACRMRSTVPVKQLWGPFSPHFQSEWKLFDNGGPGNLYTAVKSMMESGILVLTILDGSNPSLDDCVAACADGLVRFGSIFNGPVPVRVTDVLTSIWHKPPIDDYDYDDPIDRTWLFDIVRPCVAGLVVTAGNVPADCLVPSGWVET